MGRMVQSDVGAGFEIIVDGKSRSHRDRKETGSLSPLWPERKREGARLPTRRVKLLQLVHDPLGQIVSGRRVGGMNAKNIVICCDGTGNEINENISNVLKLY